MSKRELLSGENKANRIIGKCPYPGLRPFQDEDAEYFFGRESQIREIVVRLKNSRFVAVIGGSGSGKSSLVLAGAIPKLRTFAIRDSGDFWVPIIATPGTNHIDGDTPIRRLAKKFCSVLNELPPDKDQERLEQCVLLLRQPDGLDRIIQAWGRDIKNNDGVDLSLKAYGIEAADGAPAVPDHAADSPYMVKVNFLFLIDQFEELFHPSNASVNADCRHMVDRIVDHYKQGSRNDSRVCVAITMRSEHLNDCPRYPELPDAINAAAYLVKRLNEFELREAIERPARRFLRRQFQEACRHAADNGLPLPDEDEWPEDVTFDQRVIDRLLRDAEKIIVQQDHADHLPLLQHLLYWIWISAMTRNGNTDRPFPDTILFDDLLAALDASGKSSELAENTNTLTQCLKYRCEWIFNRYPDRRQAWEEVFRSLAFKEPNTGTYTQRRASMAELCHRPDIAASNEDELKRLLMPWIGPHQYLFWDESSQTVKVTHESLIRRWRRFRDWTDLVDRQFQEFLQILEDCTHWIDDGRKNKDLIEGVALRRAEDCKLPDALKDEGIRKQFDNLLRIHRDKDRLKRAITSAPEFLDRSFRKRLAMRRLQQGLCMSLVSVVISLFAIVYWRIGAQVDEQQKTLLRSYGIAAETQFVIPRNGSVDQLDEVQLPLGNVLAAMDLQNRAQNRSEIPFFAWLYSKKLDATGKFALLSESRTLSGLRRVLLENAWRHEPDAQNLSKAIKTVPRKCKVRFQPDGRDGGNGMDVNGKRAEFYTSKDRGGFGLITLPDNAQVFWGELRGKSCSTNFQQLIYWSVPKARLGFDADQRTIVDDSDGRISIIAIDWPVDGNPETGKPLPTSTRLIYNNPAGKDKAGRLQLEGSKRHVSLPTVPGEFSRDIQIGDQWFRIFDSSPVRAGMDPGELAEAQIAGGDCKKKLSRVFSGKKKPEVWELRQPSADIYCLIVSKGTDNAGAYFGDLYHIHEKGVPNLKNQNPFPIISSIALGRHKPERIRFDLKNGLMLSKSSGAWLRQPWSAGAWSRLAKDVFKQDNYRKALRDEANESRYLRANWLLQGVNNPGY